MNVKSFHMNAKSAQRRTGPRFKIPAFLAVSRLADCLQWSERPPTQEPLAIRESAKLVRKTAPPNERRDRSPLLGLKSEGPRCDRACTPVSGFSLSLLCCYLL